MTTPTFQEWNDANQRYLIGSIGVLKTELAAGQLGLDHEARKDAVGQVENARRELEDLARQLPAPAALDTLVSVFGLSNFERNMLLLCAGVELNSDFAQEIASLQGESHLFLPSFSLAMSLIPEAHWSALSPNGPLRYWRLLELTNEHIISKSPVKIDEHILHYLVGLPHLDGRLTDIAEPLTGENSLVPSHLELAGNMVQSCKQEFAQGVWPVMQLCGSNRADKERIAAYVCSQMDSYPYTIPAYALPSNTREITELARLWNREAALKSFALFIDYTELDMIDKGQVQLIHHFIDKLQGLTMLSISRSSSSLRGKTLTFDIGKPTSEEQLSLWQKYLGEIAGIMDGQLAKIVSQFDLSANVIQLASAAVVGQVRDAGLAKKETAADLERVLRKTCCSHTRPQLNELAQQIEPLTGWDDIVLPPAQKAILKEIVLQVQQRNKVYNNWGFASKNSRGLGITALFAGESGTGKTMASEVLANTLQLDLYRIDLSQVINKYVGETEKNLKQIFDAAEEGGAILLFDEADALFGKRSDVRDSHDRYANIEVSYLLQRMEAYRGLAILTTNMKSTMDKAWMRRIRFVVQFPFPDALQRTEIWRKVFPSATPTQDIRPEKLAQLSLAGGNIQNIALNAAFIAADEGMSVGMSHISRAAKSEFNKLEKPFSRKALEV